MVLEQSGMPHRFRDWLGCPACGENGEVSVLAHGSEVVVECLGCGHVSEFVIGEDVPFNSLRAEEIELADGERLCD